MVCQGEAMVGMLTPCSCSARKAAAASVVLAVPMITSALASMIFFMGLATSTGWISTHSVATTVARPFGSSTVLMYLVRPLTMSTNAGEACVDRKPTLMGF